MLGWRSGGGWPRGAPGPVADIRLMQLLAEVHQGGLCIANRRGGALWRSGLAPPTLHSTKFLETC